MHRLTCSIQVCDKRGVIVGIFTRDITFPCWPVSGLHVGSHRVNRVLVCQGDLDGAGTVCVEFDTVGATDERHATLTGQGWRYESFE